MTICHPLEIIWHLTCLGTEGAVLQLLLLHRWSQLCLSCVTWTKALHRYVLEGRPAGNAMAADAAQTLLMLLHSC